MSVAPPYLQLDDNKGEQMKSPNYVAVLAILNAMLRRLSESIPQIDQATRELGQSKIPAMARAVK